MAKQAARWVAQSQVWWQSQGDDAEGIPEETMIELEDMPPGLRAEYDEATELEERQEARAVEAEAEEEEQRTGELEPIIVWKGHHLGGYRSEKGEVGLACRRCGFSGAQGHLKTNQRRGSRLFQECQGEDGGNREQQRRQKKGLHPLSHQGSCKCEFFEGVTCGLREELAEAAGEQLQAEQQE